MTYIIVVVIVVVIIVIVVIIAVKKITISFYFMKKTFKGFIRENDLLVVVDNVVSNY